MEIRYRDDDNVTDRDRQTISWIDRQTEYQWSYVSVRMKNKRIRMDVLPYVGVSLVSLEIIVVLTIRQANVS